MVGGELISTGACKKGRSPTPSEAKDIESTFFATKDTKHVRAARAGDESESEQT